MQAIGADQQVALHPRAIGEDRGDAAVMLSDIHELHARPVASIRQSPPQRAVEQRPGAEDFFERQLRDHRAVAVEANARCNRDADQLIDDNSEPAHDLEHFDMGADADAAAGHVAAAAFEHGHVPTGLAQH